MRYIVQNIDKEAIYFYVEKLSEFDYSENDTEKPYETFSTFCNTSNVDFSNRLLRYLFIEILKDMKYRANDDEYMANDLDYVVFLYGKFISKHADNIDFFIEVIELFDFSIDECALILFNRLTESDFTFNGRNDSFDTAAAYFFKHGLRSVIPNFDFKELTLRRPELFA